MNLIDMQVLVCDYVDINGVLCAFKPKLIIVVA